MKIAAKGKSFESLYKDITVNYTLTTKKKILNEITQFILAKQTSNPVYRFKPKPKLVMYMAP